MRRLVFASHLPLNAARERALCLDFLSSRGAPVEYWDMSEVCRGGSDASAVDRPYVRRMRSWREFDAALAAPEAAETVLAPGFPTQLRNLHVLPRLKRGRAQICKILTGFLPFGPPRRGAAWRGLLKPAKLDYFLAAKGAAAARRLGLARDADVAFVAGAAAREAAGKTPCVPIHLPDYDEWLGQEKEDRRPLPGRYAVFLDQYFPHHPDLILDGIRQGIDPGRYYAALNAFFARLERSHSLEVVVAAHPKARYVENPFDGRRIFDSSTRRLSRFCELVIASYSTAISYAVLGRKPLVFIDTDELAARYGAFRVDPDHFARVLGQRFVNLDHPLREDESLRPVDPGLYDDYKYRYVVSREAEDVPTGEAFRRYLAGESGARA